MINIMTSLALIASFRSSAGMLERSKAYHDKLLEVMKAVRNFEHATSIEELAIHGAFHSVIINFSIFENKIIAPNYTILD